MRKFIVFLLCCAAIAVALGFYLDWFNLRTTRSADNRQDEIALTVDRERVKEDVAGARKRAGEVTEGVREYFTSHTVEGIVESADATAGTVTVKPKDAKEPVVLRVDKDTKIRRGEKDQTLADLQNGDRATVVYEARKDHNRAKSITLNERTVGAQPR